MAVESLQLGDACIDNDVLVRKIVLELGDLVNHVSGSVCQKERAIREPANVALACGIPRKVDSFLPNWPAKSSHAGDPPGRVRSFPGGGSE
jgi:hypothetical protein